VPPSVAGKGKRLTLLNWAPVIGATPPQPTAMAAPTTAIAVKARAGLAR
jgi:hypothetical protein